MTEQTENLVLEMLRRIRSSLDFMAADIQDLKLRSSAVELVLGQMQIQMGGVNGRLDRLDERMSRIERRFDLVEA